MKLVEFYQELLRRKVIRVAVVYILVAWILVQVAETTFEPLQLPEWSITLVIVLAAIGFPLALILAWAFELTPEGIKPETEVDPASTDAQAEVPVRSVAVLPFVDMSEHQDQEYFCDGIAEEILNALVNVSAIQVASRTSSFQYKNKEVDIKTIGEQLGVNTVLEGSVRKVGDRVRITTQLIKVSDGYHLWSEKFDRGIEDIFVVQDEIAKCVLQALEVSLSQEEAKIIAYRATDNIEAYEYYLRGWNYFHKATSSNLALALDMFNKAITLDPNFSRAYAALADTYAFLYMYFSAESEYRDQASLNSKKALALCPEAGESHVSRGMAHLVCREFDDAEKEFEQAIEISPKLFEAYYLYGRALVHQGKMELAAIYFEKAHKIRPDDYQTLLLLPQLYTSLGLEAKAEQVCLQGIELVRKHLQNNPNDARALYLGAGRLAEIGEIEEGKQWADRALEVAGEDGMALYNLACFYALAGEAEQALDCLEKARNPGNLSADWIKNDADLASIRAHPRFVALLKQLESSDS